MENRNKKVVIQGIEGCFHQVATEQYFSKDVGFVSRNNFTDLVETLIEDENVDHGVMAIENSIAGSILPNYMLMQDASISVTGEIYLGIRQNLMTLPGQDIMDLKEIHSHPMALRQCQKFLRQYPHLKLVETDDTAGSAKNIRDNNLNGVGAIAGERAASLYDMEIIAPSIETNKQNFTRFLVLSRGKSNGECKEENNKASICISTHHETGSLANILTGVAKEGVNLTKLQSFPILGGKWKYFFHMDMEFESPEQLDRALQHIKPHTSYLKVIGVYSKGKTV